MSETVVITLCQADATVQAIFGVGAAQRVYPSQVPQDVQTYPAVAFWRMLHDRVLAMGADPGLAKATYQLDVFASNATDLIAARDTLRVALNRKRGTIGGVIVEDTFWRTDLLQYDELNRLHHCVAELDVHWQEGA